MAGRPLSLEEIPRGSAGMLKTEKGDKVLHGTKSSGI